MKKLINDDIKKLNRFTTLPYLLDYLETGKLVLNDPDTWEDKNDSMIVKTYKEKSGLQSLLAICMTFDNETIHHWKAFSNGSSGCCIEFSAKKFFKVIDNIKGIRHSKILYKSINDSKSIEIKLDAIPFTKRLPYKLENEYRIIYESALITNDLFHIDVPLTSINRITFSQQMPSNVFESIKAMLILKYPNLNKKIFLSTIYKNQNWINNFKDKN